LRNSGGATAQGICQSADREGGNCRELQAGSSCTRFLTTSMAPPPIHSASLKVKASFQKVFVWRFFLLLCKRRIGAVGPAPIPIGFKKS
jgi:hypothetical protein